MRLLAARGYSVSELRLRLRRRAAATNQADTLLAKFIESGLVNDERFAEVYARARLENQGQGRLRVLADLKRRGVPAQTAAVAVEHVFGDTEEAELIERFLRRKLRGVSLREHLQEPRNLASAYRRLRRAGFSGAGSIRMLQRFSEQADELESMEEAV